MRTHKTLYVTINSTTTAMSLKATTRQRRAPKYASEEQEDAQWEDVEVEHPDSDLEFEHTKQEIVEEVIPSPGVRSPARSPARSQASSRTVSPRKRRFKTVYVAAPAPSPRRAPSSPAIVVQPPNAKLALPTEQVYDGSVFMLVYILDVLKRAIQLLRRPLSFLVFLWMFAFIVSRISQTLQAAFSPLCWIPGISGSSLCLPDGYATSVGNHQSPQWADYPTLVDVQSATIEQLLDESSSGSALALQIKKAQMATTDLVTLVRVSELKTRDMLGDALRQFVDDAKTAGRALNRLHAKVGGAVDGIMAVNDYALQTIEAAQARPPPSILRHLVPWSASKPKTDLVLSTFEDSMNYLSFTMQSLVVEFELNLQNLNKLEEQLSVLHEYVSREDNSISSAKSELLGDLWTKLGGNRRQLRGYDNHFHLLKGLTEYRKQALVHVVSALQTLTQMSEDVENLRERVAAPELTGSRIPVEVHIKSIQNGLERLKEGRSKAKVRESEAVRRTIGPDMS
ncbi:hypothetical protein DFH07DRAFT_1059675 [Mycena maculata]|uniref:Uncharacterized protein n=1 Tax=Mycena maculata TaxID=230809 RepID=A0AAD7JCV5_9AGAR|nr:hypothetical protein DFH07DRAFT_1059675 [Mycena maculata]